MLRATRTSFKRVLTVVLSALALAMFTPNVVFADGFTQAVGDYNSGKYFRALGEFKSYLSAYPNNALVHYYIALCEQGLNHLEQAKQEFQWVASHGDARLAAMAQSGIGQLANARTQISPSSRVATIAQAPQQNSTGKVKKIIEFYAHW